jgi:hypothetical protein
VPLALAFTWIELNPGGVIVTAKYFGAIVGLAMLTWGATTANASVMYTYVGHDFTIATSPFSLTDAVDGSIILSQPLGDSLVDASVTPIAFSFSDGVYNYTNADTFYVDGIIFSTNAAGAITAWDVDLELTEPYPLTGINILCCSYDLTGDQGTYDYNFGPTGIGINMDKGSWSGPLTVTPLPAAFPLFATGLSVIGWVVRRRKRKNASALGTT